MDPLIRSGLDAYETADADFVERAFSDVLRRPPDDEARERALGKLADGTLSRATFLHELAAAPEAARVRELDDARYAPCPLLVEHVEAGRLGRKSGRGFYAYE